MTSPRERFPKVYADLCGSLGRPPLQTEVAAVLGVSHTQARNFMVAADIDPGAGLAAIAEGRDRKREADRSDAAVRKKAAADQRAETNAKILKLHRSGGMTQAQIAAEVGVDQSTVSKACRKAGSRRYEEREKVAERSAERAGRVSSNDDVRSARRVRILEMHADSSTRSVIAADVGVSESTVYRTIRDWEMA